MGLRLVKAVDVRKGQTIIFRLHPEMPSLRDTVQRVEILPEGKVRIEFLGDGDSGYVDRDPSAEVIVVKQVRLKKGEEPVGAIAQLPAPDLRALRRERIAREMEERCPWRSMEPARRVPPKPRLMDYEREKE